MRPHWFWLLLLVSCAVCGEQDDDAWRQQSYKQSKHLPDLHHVVDVKLLNSMQPPAEFVLKEGRILQCSTCHGLEKMAEIPYDKVDLENPKFLRGGPYENFEVFCYRCHNKKDHERPNIHVMLNKSGEINKQHCLYCHQEVNERRDQPRKLTEVKLRLPLEGVCLGCHLKTPHLNAYEHQQAKPKEKMLKHMREASSKQGIILPLTGDGKVTCISCHSPHPEGVINAASNPAGKQVHGDVEKGIEYSKHSWDRVYQSDKQPRLDELSLKTGELYVLSYQRIKAEVLLRLPAKDGSLCLSCHEFDR